MEEELSAPKMVSILCNSGDEFNQKILKNLKSKCKNDKNLLSTIVYQQIMVNLKKSHSQVRLNAVKLIEIFFIRSTIFREALLNEFEKFINHTVPLCNLPLPKIFQKKLQEYTLETIKNWYEKFGNHYKQLAAGCNYIVNELKIKFLNNHGIHFQLSNEQFVKSNYIKSLNLKKLNNIVGDIYTLELNIKENLNSMISCFNILLPNIITRENSDRASNSAANVSSIQETIKSFGMGSHFYSIEIDISNSDLGIKENAENKIIFDTLRSSIIVLTKHLEKTKEMITKLSRLDLEADSEKIKENTVKKLIYFKNMLEANKAKYLELNINPGNLIINDEYTDDDSNEEDHIFEEVQTEGACSSTQQPSTFLERKSTSFSNLKYDRKILPLNAKVKKRADDNQKKNNISSQKIEFVRKPVSDDKGKVVGDIIIKGDYNGSSDEEEYILNNNGFEFSHHGWNRVGENPTVSSKTLKNIVRKYIKVTTLPPSNIQPCKVKSSKTGKLCERKDLVTCPIHGPIIPRDDTGRALDNIIAEKEEAQDKQEGKKQLWEILANDIETQTESFAENSAKRRRLVSKREKPTARDRLEKKFKLADKK